MLTFLFFATSVGLFAQGLATKPPTETGQKSPTPKIIINNKEIKSGKIPPLPAGATISVAKDPDTGNVAISINPGSNHKKRRNQPVNSASITSGSSTQEPQFAGNTPDTVIASINKQEIEVQGNQYTTTRLETSDGRTHFITTLAIGTLDVFYTENIRPDRATTLDASLTLNRVIPEAIKQSGDRPPHNWFIRAEYRPHNNTDYFSAKPDAELEHEILDVNQVMRWQWTVNPKPGFEKDSTTLLLKVVYITADEQPREQEIAHKEITWTEKTIPSTMSVLTTTVKENISSIVALLVGIVPLSLIYQKAKAEREKARAEAEKAKIEAATSKANFSQLAGEKSSLYSNLYQLETEKEALTRKVKELEAQINKWKIRNLSYYSLSRLRRLKRNIKHKRPKTDL